MPRRKKHAKEYSAIGKRIRDLRHSRDWSQLELADNAGLSSSYLAELERGGRNPSLETILILAAALNVSAGYLVDGLRSEPPKGMDELAAVWMVLSKAKQQALVQLASLLVPEKRAPRNRSSSAGKRRAKTSK